MNKNWIKEAINEYMSVNSENYFVKEVFKNDMKDPLEVLNWYRNLYHNEDADTERGFMARVINTLFTEYSIKEK